MAVSTAYTPLTYTGTGSAGPFTVTWPFIAATDLVVTVVDSDGAETSKTYPTHFTVTGGSGSNGIPGTGTVTMQSGHEPETGETLRITRSTTKTQSTSLIEGGSFAAKSVEAALDKLLLIAQENSGGGDANDGITGDVMTLNSAGATDYWDGESNPILYVSDSTDATAAATYGQLSDAVLESGGWMGSAGATDNRMLRADGTGGATIQNSAITVNDSGDMSGIAALSATTIELGATDTTLSRSAAGRIAVESVDLALDRFTAAGTGATNRTLQSKLRDTVSVYDYGATGNGTTDDTTAIQAAIDGMGSAGGVLLLPRTGKFRVGNLTIKPNVALVGEVAGRDATADNITFVFSGIGSALLTNASTTITLQRGASIERCLMYPYAMAAAIDSQTTTTNFAGTALTLAGFGACVRGCMILGYAQAIAANGYSRLTIENNNIDAQAAIYIQATYDTTRILNNHCWPYLTHASFWASGANYAARDKTKLYRTGSGIRLTNGSDDTRLDGNIVYGFLVGIELQAVGSVNTGINWIDHPSGVNRSNNIGLYLRNNVTDVLMQTCMIWGVKNGLVAEMNAGEVVLIDLVHAESIDNVGVSITAGDLYFGSLHVESTGSYAVSVAAAASAVHIQDYQFKSIGATYAISPPSSAVTNKLMVGPGIWDGAAGGILIGPGAIALPSVASADPLNLPVNGSAFTITGTTSFGTIVGGWGGRRVTLVFAGALTVYDGSIINLSGDFVTIANDTLEIQHDGTQWLEVGRTSQDAPAVRTYTVATLPTSAAAKLAYASNGRKNGEGGGAGTGVLVFRDGTAWRACDTGATVAA